MIQKLNQRRSALAALTQQHLDGIYDLIFQVYGDRDTSVAMLQKVVITARRRYRFDRLERYARLWILRITIEQIHKRYRHFLAEQVYGYEPSFAPLSLEEKLCVLLFDRVGLNLEEIASVMQLHSGRVGRSLVYGHEKLAAKLGYKIEHKSIALPDRVRLQTAAPGIVGEYTHSVAATRTYVAETAVHTLEEIDASVRIGQVLALLAQPKEWRWSTLSWKTKLSIEFAGFAVVGALMVIALPWTLEHINTNALYDGRFSDVLQIPRKAVVERDEDVISAERLIASKDLDETESNRPNVKDEFSNYEFPSGDSYEVGSAPLAPSRQSAAVYRLIVQSPNPREMIPVMHELFDKRKVRERELSGRAMPGGVYFDGITTQGDYPSLLKAIQDLKQVGKTATYGNRMPAGNPNERARVIIWIQQI